MVRVKSKIKAKQKAWEYYNKWRKKKRGWRHISGATGSKKRTFSDMYRRMKLLPWAREIIEESTTIQNITVKRKTTFYALEAVKIVRGLPRKIRVILVEDRKKNKIFLSVMDKKTKNGTPHA